ncbi:Hypothetical_protein [Hexamita inflata]|uniref:Hypothetical_protein n=1 Tax=Hexamita inflata TaxID=28002 RepID=A0AA86NYD2_9EUKA|nr:Hypothetical protein HINF_LOCUS14681 [Hexamita inflata]
MNIYDTQMKGVKILCTDLYIVTNIFQIPLTNGQHCFQDNTQSRIQCVNTLEHHKNFSKYDFEFQRVPTTDELTFYNKILSVHSSHRQIKIQLNKISKFRETMTQKEHIKFKINEIIQVMNKKIEIIFSQNYYTDQQ